MAAAMSFHESRIIDRYPADPSIVMGCDGLAYKVKHDRDLMVEYICAMAAQTHGMPIPRIRVLRDPLTGKCGMGYAWEDCKTLADTDCMLTLFNGPGRTALARSLSKLVVFDLYFNISDRHLGNLLVRQTPFGPQIMAIDHSSASLLGILTAPTTLVGCYTNTAIIARIVFRHLSFDLESAWDVLHSFATIDVARIGRFYASEAHPDVIEVIRQQPMVCEYFQALAEGDEDAALYRELRIAAIRKHIQHFAKTGNWMGGEVIPYTPK